MFANEYASNAGMYDCPRCIYDFPEKHENYNTVHCLYCQQGSNFVKREISQAEALYDAGAKCRAVQKE